MSMATSLGTTGSTRTWDPTPRLPKNIVYSYGSTRSRSPSPLHHSIYPEMFTRSKPKQTSKFYNRINAVIWQPYEGLVKIPPKCNKVVESKKAEADLKPVESKKAEADLKPVESKKTEADLKPVESKKAEADLKLLPSGHFSHWYGNDLIEKRGNLQFPSAVKTAFDFFEPYAFPTPRQNQRKDILLTFWKDSLNSYEYSGRPSARMEYPIRFTNACGLNIHLAWDTFMTVSDITDAGLANCIQDNLARPRYNAISDPTKYTPNESTELQCQTAVFNHYGNTENSYTSEGSLPTTPRSSRYSTSPLEPTLIWHSTPVKDSMPGRDINGHTPARSAYFNSSDGYAIGSSSRSWDSSNGHTSESSDNCNQSFCGYEPKTTEYSSYLNSSDGYPTDSSRSWGSSNGHTLKSSAYTNSSEEYSLHGSTEFIFRHQHAPQISTSHEQSDESNTDRDSSEEHPLKGSSHFISRDEYAPQSSECHDNSDEYASQNNADCETSEEYPLPSHSQFFYRDEYAPPSGANVELADGYGPQSGADVDPESRYCIQSSAYVDPGNEYGVQSSADVDPGNGYGVQSSADVDPENGYGPQTSDSKGCNVNVTQRPISRCNPYAQLSPIDDKQAADVEDANVKTSRSQTYGPFGYTANDWNAKIPLPPISGKHIIDTIYCRSKTVRSPSPAHSLCEYTAKDQNVKTPLPPISVRRGIDTVDCNSTSIRSKTPSLSECTANNWNAKEPLPPISSITGIGVGDCERAGKRSRTPSELSAKDWTTKTPLPPISGIHGIGALDCKNVGVRSQIPIARNVKTPLPPISDIHGIGALDCKNVGFRSQIPIARNVKTPLPPISDILVHGIGALDCKSAGFRSQIPIARNVKMPLPPISDIHGIGALDCKSAGFRSQIPIARNVKTPLPPISDIHGIGALDCKSAGFRSQIPIARNVKMPLPPISDIHGIGALDCKSAGFRSQIPIARNVKTPLPPISGIHGIGAVDCKSEGIRSQTPEAWNIKTPLPPISSKHGNGRDDSNSTENRSPASNPTARDWYTKTPLLPISGKRDDIGGGDATSRRLPPISGKRDDIAGGDATSRRLPPISTRSKHGAAGDIVNGEPQPSTPQHSAGNRSARGYLPPIQASIPTGYDHEPKENTPRTSMTPTLPLTHTKSNGTNKMPLPPMLQLAKTGIDDSTTPESLSPPKCDRAKMPLSPIPRMDLITDIGGNATPDTRDVTQNATPDTNGLTQMPLPPIPFLDWNSINAEIMALYELYADGKFTMIPSSPLSKQDGAKTSFIESNAELRQTNVAKYWNKKTGAIQRERLWQEPTEAMDPPKAQDSVLDPTRAKKRRKRLEYLERVFADAMKHDEELLTNDS